MNDMFEALKSAKSCFGFYESFNSSWHCIACPIKHECEARGEEIENEHAEA